MIVLKLYLVIAVVTAIILSAKWLHWRKSDWCPYWIVILASMAWPVTAGVLIGHLRDKYWNNS